MPDVEIHVTENHWSSTDNVWVRGEIFADGDYYEGDGHSLFDDVHGYESLVDRLSTLNGQYAVIVDSGDTVYAAVDHIRSVPLYYGLGDDVIYVSDTPSWIRSKITHDACDPAAATEFILTGYVTGTDTLYPTLKQLQPGQILSVPKERESHSVDQYYSFTEPEIVGASRQTLQEQLDAVLERSFERLETRAAGRPLLLGLSGGYDSRLIALMLDRIGYEDVYTFTFPDFLTDGDQRIASQVADSLSFDWVPIDVTEEDFWEFFHSEEYKQLQQSVEDYATVTPFLFWNLVLRKVRDSPDLPDEGIVLTGHDIAGSTSHLPEFEAGTVVDRETVVDWVWDHHYNMRHTDDTQIQDEMKERIRDRLGPIADGDQTAVTNAVMEWYWKERTPKFLARNVDSYAFWGYDRWLPLWDRQLAAFWATVPVEYTRDKALYEEHIDQLSEAKLDLPSQSTGSASGGSSGSGGSLSVMETAISHLPIEKTVRTLFRKWQARSVKQSEQYRRYGFLTEKQFESLFPRARHPKYFHALDQLSSAECSPPSGSPLAEDLALYTKYA